MKAAALLLAAVIAGVGADVAAAPTSAFPAAPGIRVASGFRAEIYASGLRNPTAMAFSPGRRLYVTQEGGEVVAVAPRSRRPRVVARGFRTPLGITWHGRALFVSARGALWRVARGRGRAVVAGLPHGLHQQNNVVVGRDGRLYFGSGSTCNACRERSRLSAAVLSVRADGRDLRVIASGLRNPFGLAVEPRSGRLFASVNSRDDLGEWEPAEMVVEVRPRRTFGWPACWPSWRARRLVGRCTGVTPPVAYLEPHSSPDGMAFYDGRSFPARYRGDLFVAEWGQYYSRAHGRVVVRVELDRGGNARRSRVSVFARGFEHPLAVAVDPLGALLVADHGRGVIYRIQARGKP